MLTKHNDICEMFIALKH